MVSKAMSVCEAAESGGEKKLLQELWRVRLNWACVAALSVLATLSNTSVSSSFHQFVINPQRSGGTNTTTGWTGDEFGLGESEIFYSWLIAVFNFGSVFGAILCGFLIKCLPYWHLFAVGLVAHIAGFLLCAITNEAWLILVSKFLSGYFLGVQWSLGISYTAESSEEYVSILHSMGRRVEEGSVERVKRYVFSSHSVGAGIGFIMGPGAAVVFAQFPLDQFRAIAWYNVATGAVLLLLQVLIFRGESECSRLASAKNACECVTEARNCIKNGPLRIFIVFSFLLFLCVGALRFGYFETLFNPVLSDSFGFDERDSSYYFFALVWPYLGGVVLLVLLQRVKLSSQSIAIVGIVMTFASCLLSTDWQAIPPDPCVEFSPFHHPELIHNYSHTQSQSNSMITHLRHSSDNDSRLNVTRNENGTEQSGMGMRANTRLLPSMVLSSSDHNESETLSMERVYVQELATLTDDVYIVSKHNCEHANVTAGRCHWLPSSEITGKECSDCQPICRNTQQTLTFWQFALGTSILMASLPILWVSLVAITSFQVRGESQGLLGAAIASVNSAARGIGPLILDPAYERMQKRTFLAMFILFALHLPILLELLVLCPWLGPRSGPEAEYARLQSSDKHTLEAGQDSEQ